MIFQFQEPIRFNDGHFEIKPDETTWSSLRYRNIGNGSRSRTPDRARATFENAEFGLHRSLIARTDRAKALGEHYGVYVLIFRLPRPAYYAGISRTGGVLKRIRTHRVKATGSHVGTQASDGGVNHTDGWPSFAKERACYHSQNGLKDICDDAILLIGKLMSGEISEGLDHVEGCIDRDYCGLRTRLFSLLGNPPAFSCPMRLNSRSGQFIVGQPLIVKTWCNQEFECEPV